MKNIWIVALTSLFLLSCGNKDENKNKQIAQLEETQENFSGFGANISAEGALTAEEMSEKFQNLKLGDTVKVKFRTSVNSVCKMKGCWMTLNLPDMEEEPMVKFKDYGFFVPKDIEGKEVVVEGVAFIEETSVEDQKHFAEDAGKSEEEIAAILQPKRSPGFLANGVLIKQ
ncbi:DUF4920 domain-containing protein [Gramella sp. GC03-9]|uniref:DUF4920 domain-containing protein n=1 Tax=Christiangramia oceanisediminis TaxID=2920386 RepID=A0A9X2I703_9FLAO|nr:DUF4920 domain-containing protein [Gramella oceanisediminis]MCP9198367.1 DUF4920 domain-containing protein [Gramella oceanisediminis]